MAVCYWCLGDYLSALREKLRRSEQLAHGEWQEWLTDTLKIDLTRAQRAIRIRKRHERPEDCSGKTLWEALDYRPRKTPMSSLGPSVNGTSSPSSPRPSNSLLTPPLKTTDDEEGDNEEWDRPEVFEFGDDAVELPCDLSNEDLEAAQRFVDEVGPNSNAVKDFRSVV